MEGLALKMLKVGQEGGRFGRVRHFKLFEPELAIIVSCGLAADAELLHDLGQHAAWKPDAAASLSFLDRFPE